MSDGWTTKPLVEIADIVMGQSPPSSTYNDMGQGLPFFQGKAEFGDVYPTIVKYCSSPQRIAEKGDVLMTVRAPVGPVNIAPTRCCIGRGLSAIRAKKNKLDQSYLFYFLKSIESKLSAIGQGSTFSAINRMDIEQLQVHYPTDISTQKKIATILQRTHRLLQKREQANHVTDKIIQSVFLKMFGDLTTNPKGWPLIKLNEVCQKITDGTHVTPRYVNSGIPFLSVKDIRSGYIDFSDTKFISEKQHRELTVRSKPELDDILYTKVGTVGIAALVDTKKEFSIFVSVALLKPDSSLVDSKFLRTMMNSQYVKSQAHRRVKGIGVPDLHLVEIRDFDIILPPMEMQKRFSDILTRVESLRMSQRESTREINQLFHSLMDTAFDRVSIHTDLMPPDKPDQGRI